MSEPEIYRFDDDGCFPNSSLPLLVYRAALPANAAAMQQAFAANGWSNAWRNGIYDYHHFHSIAHEVLGIAAGEARVAFGGPGGQTVSVRAGDVIVIPAGVGHCNKGESAGFLVVGAYPGGGKYDIKRGDPAEYQDAVRAVTSVAIPEKDPVSGGGGPLARLWKTGEQ